MSLHVTQQAADRIKKFIDMDEKKQAKPLANYNIGDFLMIINDEEGPHNFRAAIDLAYKEGYRKLLPELEKRKSEMRDLINMIIVKQGESILVADKMREQEVKSVVGKLKKKEDLNKFTR